MQASVYKIDDSVKQKSKTARMDIMTPKETSLTEKKK